MCGVCVHDYVTFIYSSRFSLSSQEFTLALTQLAKHISYVRGTASFLLKQTRGVPSPVAMETESPDHARLSGEIAQVATACRALHGQVCSLEMEVYKVGNSELL